MTLTKAIDELATQRNIHLIFGRTKEADALQLGIEALKYYQQERERRGAIKTMWLPGETGE